MKELSIEEKAKAYDEAINTIRNLVKAGLIYEDAAIQVFPALKESEDERIKKCIIDTLKGYHHLISTGGITKEDMIAWLKKQGEKTTAWTPMDEQRVENLLAIIERHGYPGEVAWLNSLKDRVQSKQSEQKSAWSEEDDKILKSIIINIENLQFSDDMQEKYYHTLNTNKSYYQIRIDWLKSLKGRVQPKQEWSEEDEKLYNDLSDTYFYNDEDYPEETYKRMLKRVLDWMNKRAKFLRPQSTWKPTEMQLKCLKNACDEHWEPDGSDPLYALYQDLKKLREE